MFRIFVSKGVLPQRSSQSKQDLPSLILTLAKPLNLFKGFKISLHQKTPSLMSRVNFQSYSNIPTRNPRQVFSVEEFV
jgi:hypothetical protein